jgi:hypothetical protein
MEVLQDEQIGITGNDGVDSGGMKAAKARGKHLGRPRTPARVITAVEELVRTTDLSVREIQRRIGAKTGRGVVGDIVKRIRHDSKLEAHAAKGDLEKLPSWQFFKTRSENAVSASLHFSSA